MKWSMTLLALISLPSIAATNPAGFHQAIYALHEQQIAQHKIRTEQSEAQYEGAAAQRYAYVDTYYYDAVSSHLISRVRRDAAMPEYVHIIEVNIYENGRLVRDFGSLTLPWAPLHPTRTFINLHHYNGSLHSFRQYDFNGDIGYESCEGKFEGKPVRISLDGSDSNAKSTSTAIYQACFKGINANWEQYKTPH